jgi:hypothetical protein
MVDPRDKGNKSTNKKTIRMLTCLSTAVLLMGVDLYRVEKEEEQ